jgi:hypothetical protein
LPEQRIPPRREEERRGSNLQSRFSRPRLSDEDDLLAGELKRIAAQFGKNAARRP